MQIEIDFEVFKALTTLREREADSYNDVIRRLLDLPPSAFATPLNQPQPKGMFGGLKAPAKGPTPVNALAAYLNGVWFNNVFFPEGTRFRANYKGKTYLAEIKDGRWVGADGVVRNSPSDAASSISGTNVNGWRFWYAMGPGDTEWRRLDEFR